MRISAAFRLGALALALSFCWASTLYGAYPATGKGVIEGYVWLPDGKPAVGARVRCEMFLLRWARQMAVPLSVEAVTDEHGAYRVDVFGEGDYILRADLPGYAPRFSRLVKANTPLDFYLEEGHELRGRVTIAQVREPIPRAKVYLIYEFHQIGPAETNRNGEYRFRNIPSLQVRQVFVEGIKVGWANAIVEHVDVMAEEPTIVNFELGRGGAATGRVTLFASKEPAPNLKIRITGQGREDEIVRTDERGQYRIDALSGGVITAEVIDDRLMLVESVKNRAWINRGATEVFDLVVRPQLQASGTVRDSEGRPVGGAVVTTTVNYEGDFLDRSVSPPPLATVGEVRLFSKGVRSEDNGAFTLSGLASGRCIPVAWAPGYLLTPGDPFVVSEKRRGADIDLVLRKGVTLQGAVRDQADAPVAGAKLHVRTLGAATGFDGEPSCGDLIVYTNGEGRYSVAGVEFDRPIFVRASAGGFQLSWADLAEAKDGDVLTQDFTLAPAPALAGRIVDSQGHPIHRAVLTISGSKEAKSIDVSRVATDPEGRFRAPGPGTAPYSAIVEHPLYHQEKIGQFDPGEEIALTLYRYGAIEGELHNYPQDYTRPILISATNADGAHTRPVNFPHSAKTFRIDKLYPGTYRLYATDHEAVYEATVEGVELKEGDTVRGVKIFFKKRRE